MTSAIFAYGTLQRGQVREPVWPRRPTKVVPAIVSGHLFDLGPYPAFTQGTDRVAGELWCFDQADIGATLSVLDVVEHYQQEGPDWYQRRLIRCTDSDGIEHDAYIYEFARCEELHEDQRVPPDADGLCRWPSNRC